MAALVQIFPQQTGSATMLQTRPTSANGRLPMPQGQPGQQYPGSPQRQAFYGGSNGVSGGPIVYRTTPAPIQPYAFTSTPSLNMNTPRQHQHSQQQQQQQQQQQKQQQNMQPSHGKHSHSRQPASASMINLSTSSTLSGGRYTFGSRDDSSLPNQGSRRGTLPSQTTYTSGASSQSFAQAASARASPERYRRAMPRTVTNPAASVQGQQQKLTSAAPSGSGMASIGHLYGSGGSNTDVLSDYRMAVSGGQSQQQLDSHRRNSTHGAAMTTMDDMQLYRQSTEEARRYRRRSMPSVDFMNHATPQVASRKSEPAPRSPDKDKHRVAASSNNLASGGTMMRNKDGSSESVSSLGGATRPSSTNRNSSATAAPTVNPASSVTTVFDNDTSGQNKGFQKHVNIPLRGSSDAAIRAAAPVSQSRPTAMDVAADGDKKKASAGSAASMASDKGADSQKAAKGNPSLLESPAMRHLTAINQKGGKLRSKTSRLRRAFSFGSAADFRDAPVMDADGKDVAGTAAANKLQHRPTNEELYDAEQDRIAQRQEEAGIGSSIYAGARIFSGSTDNLSISSTASSASIMIRKMGRGMKKGSRSLVGLFRPKSVGASGADAGEAETGKSGTTNAAIEATVSMVTAEAERERGNVNGDRHAQGSGSGCPRLERNSVDASVGSAASDRLSSSGTDNSARKSIVGGERERAEVLAAVRKGILKHTSGSRSPSCGPTEDRGLGLELPCPPAMNESPASSAPSTPNDDSLGHKRTGSVAIGGEDYFVSALRLRQDSKSGSSTPQGSMRRNATFSPRIIFCDTWPSQEYDRRGEIATCNRLTPMLAQQIKEELNSFKMEMEVHENSKIYTHFF